MARSQERNPAGILGPQQLAHLRAKLYAQRGVTNREAAVLLEAYDDLVRQLDTAMDQSPRAVESRSVLAV